MSGGESLPTTPTRTSKEAPVAPLTGLERELLIYVERLTTASETSAAQFLALEKRSSASIAERLDALDHCARSLIESQVSLIETLSAFANSSPTTETARQALRASISALQRAEDVLAKMPD